jgi:hypothetical protein
MPVTAIPEEHLAIITQAEAVLEQFNLYMNGENSSLIIRSEQEYVNAAVVIKTVKAYKKLLLSSKEKVVGPLYKKYKETLSVFSEKEVLVASKICSLELAGKNFRKAVEAEAAKKQIEADRIAAEARRKAEETAEKAKQKAEEAAANGRSDLAEKWESKALESENTASSIVADIVSPEIPQNTKNSFNTRKTYAARIVYVDKILEYFKVSCPPDILSAVQKWCNAQARASKGAKSTLPGVIFYES